MLRIHTDTTQRISALPPMNRAAPRAAAAIGGDTIDLSPTARAFLSARQSLSALPPVRQERVGELQGLVSSGSYRVNGETCAVAMLASEEADAGE
jgi:flagellar biosynthesis anti-sigma factor FlgM